MVGDAPGPHLDGMSKALVLLGHAEPQSFNGRLARAYAEGFTAAGGLADVVALSELSFDPVLRHGFAGEQPLEPDLARLRARFEWATQVTWVFPTYWASPPAIVKAVVDRLFLPGWAFRYTGRPLPEGLLAGRASRVITTMDSPALWYALAHHRAIHGAFGRGTLRFVGFAPVQVNAIYGVRRATAPERERELVRAARFGGTDATRRAAKRTPIARLAT